MTAAPPLHYGPTYRTDKARARALAEAMGDFPTFCGLLEYVDIETGQRRPMRFTPMQRAFNAHRSRADIVVKPRRVFMSSNELARDVWWFLRPQGGHVVVVVQAEKDHANQRTFSRMVQVYFESLRRFMRIDLRRETDTEWWRKDSTLRIVEAGAAERTAAKGGRGGPCNRLHLSEVAFYEHAVKTLTSLQGAMVGNDTEQVIESTANGAAGFFYETYQGAKRTAQGLPGGNGYRPHFYPWYTHGLYRQALEPGEVIVARDEREAALLARGVLPEALKWYRHKAGTMPDAASMRQEYPDDDESCFLDAHAQYIPTSIIEDAVDPQMPIIEGVAYAGLDIGRENDRTVLIVIKQDRYGRLYVQELDSCKRTDWDALVDMVVRSWENWGWRRIAVDRTGMGTFPADWMQKQFGRERVDAIDFTLQNKADLATGLYRALADRVLTLTTHPELPRDLKALRRIVTAQGNVTYDAPRTKDGHADSAWALALALYACNPLRDQGGRSDEGDGDFQRTT